jgi:hypothetical protein
MHAVRTAGSTLSAGLVVILSLVSSPAESAHAAEPGKFRSQQLILTTDLPEEQAKALLAETQKMLDFVAAYWKRPLRGPIECYVVADMANWKMKFPEQAVRSIELGVGVTITETFRSGKAFQAKATVYAAAKGTSAKHEVVHAYCRQSFGEVGPLWYAEGMAEVGQYWRENESGVNCEAGLARTLRQGTPKPLNEILEMKVRSGETYSWAWSLCHLMANHPRYQERFKQLGLNLLAGKKVDFRTVFAKELDQIEFERRLMLANIEPGYRIDLAAWDWDAEFGPPAKGATRDLEVQAARGWQATGLELKRGERIAYRTQGSWRIEANGTALSADGDRAGNGKLVGVLLTDGQLGEPFELGRQGSWTARADGRLFVRCQDAWHKLADNEGSITLTLPQAENTTTVAASPKREKAKAAASSDKTKTATKSTTLEEQAAAKLLLARQLLEKNPSAAKLRLQEIVKQHSGTAAANEAAELLRDLGE